LYYLKKEDLIMCNEVENKKDVYLDLSRFSEMETEEIITYLKDNPDKKISPEYAEASGFFEISEDIKASGEEELAIKLLELYYNAVKEARGRSFYEISPDVDSVYAYGMHLLGGRITPADQLNDELKSLFVQLCMKGVAIYAEEIDEILDKYPQFAMMLDTVPELAYADDDGIYAQLLCNIGWAYQRGTEKIKQDQSKAFYFFSTGAELDYEDRYLLWPRAKAADCAFEAAVCLMKGIGVEKDLDSALEYLEIGARGYGEQVVPPMADIYLDPDFSWEDYFEDDEDRYLAAFWAFDTRVRNFDGSYMKPATHYTEVDWDFYQEDYDEEKKWKMHNLIINLLDDYAHSGSVKSAKALAFAYEEGILVEESEMQTDYYLDLAYSNAEEE
jgi:hypothetical protein